MLVVQNNDLDDHSMIPDPSKILLSQNKSVSCNLKIVSISGWGGWWGGKGD